MKGNAREEGDHGVNGSLRVGHLHIAGELRLRRPKQKTRKGNGREGEDELDHHTRSSTYLLLRREIRKCEQSLVREHQTVAAEQIPIIHADVHTLLAIDRALDSPSIHFVLDDEGSHVRMNGALLGQEGDLPNRRVHEAGKRLATVGGAGKIHILRP